MLKISIKKEFSLHLLVDLLLLTNAYILSKFGMAFFFRFLYEKPGNKMPSFNLLNSAIWIEWIVLLIFTALALISIRSSQGFPHAIENLKNKMPKLLLIIFLGELLRFSLGFISGNMDWIESTIYSFCFFSSLIFYRIIYTPRKTKAIESRILLFGAGEAGEDFLKNEKKQGRLKNICGILDDDANKKGKLIEGIPVLGNFEDCFSYIYSLKINEIIICVEKISATRLGNVIDKIDVKRVKIRIIPGLKEIHDHKKQATITRDINAEDLLGRATIVLNNELIKKDFEDKKILITGAGGSIGSEICHQLLFYPIKELVCISRSEFSLYELQEKLSEENTLSIPVFYFLGNIQDIYFLDSLFRRFTPDIVFHAAAHKHVPYMETQEIEAIKNNVIGTENILRASRKHGVKKCLLISTDKAVNPRNVMGASKRLAEILSESYFEREKLVTAIVRFGNVLGSKGSVVPLFRKQILKGGPITVTHPEVVRYFMTIPEAALLVINCGALARGGEKFILDMGKPIQIDNLVKKLIRLYGFKPNESIEIKYTGLRAGEKLVEELITDGEKIEKTINKKIFISRSANPISNKTLKQLDELQSRIHQLSGKEIRNYFKKIIPEFKGKV